MESYLSDNSVGARFSAGLAIVITEESIVKVIHITPETVITIAALRDQAVNVGVPLQIPAEGMEDHDKTGSEIHGLILFEKHS